MLGHVDHGKSSLLEAIKEEFRITAKEAGGITQRIGAYVAEIGGKSITFLDTPGHEAFSAMRSRGAKAADIGVLVVAADDGVQTQTKEAIRQAKEARIPLVVAINKADKPGAEPEKIKQQLAQEEVLVEAFGGQTPCVLTSAVSKQGIQELLEMILLIAEVEDLSADASAPARGLVIEAFLDQKRGPAASLLVLDGTLRAGDIVGTQTAWGKVKILEDSRGISAESALPSFPCLVVGLQGVPGVGEEFHVFSREEDAVKNIVPVVAQEFHRHKAAEGVPTLDIILKADVQGSLEVVKSVLLKIPQEKIALRFVNESVGEIGESDVRTAAGTKARIIAFRAKSQAGMADLAEREGVVIETFEVIYDLIQRVRDLMEKGMAAETVKRELGSLKVLAVFLADKNRQIVGGRVGSGEILKGSKLEVTRGEQVVGQGKVVNLQKQKKDAGKAIAGEECGILYEGPEKIQQGDILRAFVIETQLAVL